MRVVALLFAVLMVGATAHTVAASPDVAAEVDELPDLAPQIVSEMVVVPWPDRGGSVRVDAPRSQACGRAHTDLVFRPPRAFASR